MSKTTVNCTCPSCKKPIDVVFDAKAPAEGNLGAWLLAGRRCWNCGAAYLKVFDAARLAMLAKELPLYEFKDTDFLPPTPVPIVYETNQAPPRWPDMSRDQRVDDGDFRDASALFHRFGPVTLPTPPQWPFRRHSGAAPRAWNFPFGSIPYVAAKGPALDDVPVLLGSAIVVKFDDLIRDANGRFLWWNFPRKGAVHMTVRKGILPALSDADLVGLSFDLRSFSGTMLCGYRILSAETVAEGIKITAR